MFAISSQFIFLMAGLLLLWGGAEVLVRNAVHLAKSQGVRPMIIGLTLVAFGTSVPELVVSNLASLQGDSGISLGNIIGSNIANIALILGAGALLSPLAIESRWVRKETPLMLVVTALFILLAYSGKSVSSWEGFVLVLMFIVLLFYLARAARRDMNTFKLLQAEAENPGDTDPRQDTWKYLLLCLFGLAVLLGGSKLSVDSGVALAEQLQVSDSIIGLTIIALGTSLPELATTIVSATRNAADIAVGNIIGSNIFNLALIGGTSAMIRPLLCDEPKLLYSELPLLAGTSLILWLMMLHRHRLGRVKGTVLVAGYVLFLYLTVVQ